MGNLSSVLPFLRQHHNMPSTALCTNNQHRGAARTWFCQPLAQAKSRYAFHSLMLALCILLTCCASPNAASPTSTPVPTPSPTPSVPTVTKALTTYKGHTGPVISAIWSPDGTRIASCGNDGTVQVWTATNGKTLWNASIDRYAFALAWSPDGKKLIGGGNSGSLSLLDAADGHKLATYEGQRDAIEGLAWSPDG